MTILESSTLRWIAGALAGAATGYAISKHQGREGTFMKTLAGAGLGTIVLVVIGDRVVEQYQRTGVFSLMPLSWTSKFRESKPVDSARMN
jgi:hypothetical protein